MLEQNIQLGVKGKVQTGIIAVYIVRMKGS